MPAPSSDSTSHEGVSRSHARPARVSHDIRTASGTHRIHQHVPDLDEVYTRDGAIHIEDMGGGVWSVVLGGGAMTLSVRGRRVTVIEEREERVRR